MSVANPKQLQMYDRKQAEANGRAAPDFCRTESWAVGDCSSLGLVTKALLTAGTVGSPAAVGAWLPACNTWEGCGQWGSVSMRPAINDEKKIFCRGHRSGVSLTSPQPLYETLSTAFRQAPHCRRHFFFCHKHLLGTC